MEQMKDWVNTTGSDCKSQWWHSVCWL